jgi:hypothetical protein
MGQIGYASLLRETVGYTANRRLYGETVGYTVIVGYTLRKNIDYYGKPLYGMQVTETPSRDVFLTCYDIMSGTMSNAMSGAMSGAMSNVMANIAGKMFHEWQSQPATSAASEPARCHMNGRASQRHRQPASQPDVT